MRNDIKVTEVFFLLLFITKTTYFRLEIRFQEDR